jgi:hypothetical protein
MFKILCTGNPDHIGIAMEIKKLFPDASFASRSNGYDLTTKEGLDKLRATLKNYNVFINNAHVQRNTQITLLSMVRDEWETGHIFNIGTLDEYKKWLPANPENYEEATRMKELGLELTDEHFKVTHVTVGAFKSSAKPSGLPYGMDPKYIAMAIKWVMEADFQVPVIGVEQSSDHVRNYMSQQKKKRSSDV